MICSLNEEIFRYSPGDTQENHEEMLVRITVVPADIVVFEILVAVSIS
jgi:hypothetical protein